MNFFFVFFCIHAKVSLFESNIRVLGGACFSISFVVIVVVVVVVVVVVAAVNAVSLVSMDVFMYFAGLLAAYDLSNDKIFLDKATDLAT